MVHKNNQTTYLDWLFCCLFYEKPLGFIDFTSDRLMLNWVLWHCVHQAEIPNTTRKNSKLCFNLQNLHRTARVKVSVWMNMSPTGRFGFLCRRLHWWQQTYSSQLGAAAGRSCKQPRMTELMRIHRCSEKVVILVQRYPCRLTPKFRHFI